MTETMDRDAMLRLISGENEAESPTAEPEEESTTTHQDRDQALEFACRKF